MSLRRLVPSLGAALLLCLPIVAQRSHVRIVRVSLASGAVQLNLQDGRGWQPALLNAPISESDQVRTGADARAELELEDGSTLRLIPESQLTFQTLALENGERLTEVVLNRGAALVELRGHDAAGFQLDTPQGSVRAADNKLEFRASLASGGSDIHVNGGAATVVAGDRPYALGRNESLTLLDRQPAALSRDRGSDDWDQWSRSRDKLLAHAKAFGKGAGATRYGMAELTGAGSWNRGCWSPYGMGAGWSPFNGGSWFFDPVLGNTWVSSYTWGWAPYHFGSWLQNDSGWCWDPNAGFGNGFYGGGFFNPVPVVKGSGGQVLPPPPPPPPPVKRRLPDDLLIATHGGGGSPAASGVRLRVGEPLDVLVRNPSVRRDAPSGVRMSKPERDAEHRAAATRFEIQAADAYARQGWGVGRRDDNEGGGMAASDSTGGSGGGGSASVERSAPSGVRQVGSGRGIPPR